MQNIEPFTDRRVLVVDDDRDFADGLADLLGAEGYDVQTSYSIVEACSMIESFDAQVAVLDFKLGDGDGIELFDALKKQRPDLVCLLLTAYSDIELAIRSLRHGFEDYIRKPILGDDVLHTLERTFEMLRLTGERRQVEEARLLAQRMAVVAQVTGGVAHHCNNLLMVMQWKLEQLRKSMPMQSDTGKLFDELFNSTDKMAGINNKLLAYTGQALFNPEILDLASVVRQAVDKLRADPALTLNITQHAVPDSAPVLAQSSLLMNAVIELVQNAAKAGPNDMTVELSVENLSAERCREQVGSEWHHGPGVLLQVSDNGNGMPEDVASRAVEPFYSEQGLADNAGLGLGLSAIQGFVDQCGGAMKLDSQPDVGTTVSLIFPVAQN